ncbi:MAG TPA: hypothetical protein VK642_02290 [Burkholderiales bacterium]|nr:hypothetical protein [Burkholderiales bacterium]
MGVVTTLSKQAPAAAKFKAKLEALENELAQLRAENVCLKQDLAQYIEQWETLDGPQVSTLQYLATNASGQAAAIAKAINVNIQIAETSLVFLQKCAYVDATASNAKPSRGKNAQFRLSAKGTRYLRSRGIHK